MNTEKLELLIKKLKIRNNKSSVFFEKVLKDLKDEALRSAAIERLSSCYSITQYSNFNKEEETLLKDIIVSLES